MTGWSLYDIDETDIESLLPFVFRYPEYLKEHDGKGSTKNTARVFADQVEL